MKRIAISVIFGLVAGAMCAAGGFLGGILGFTAANLLFVLLNRAVMGFAIGVSGLRLHWAWNGIVVGLVVGSVFSFFLYLTLGTATVPLVNAMVNGLFGLMIEFFTTVVFKVPAQASAPRLAQVVSA